MERSPAGQQIVYAQYVLIWFPQEEIPLSQCVQTRFVLYTTYSTYCRTKAEQEASSGTGHVYSTVLYVRAVLFQ
jgi:hypothetical protein